MNQFHGRGLGLRLLHLRFNGIDVVGKKGEGVLRPGQCNVKGLGLVEGAFAVGEHRNLHGCLALGFVHGVDDITQSPHVSGQLSLINAIDQRLFFEDWIVENGPISTCCKDG